MNDDRFDQQMTAIEETAKAMVVWKGDVVALLSYASQQRSQSQGEEKTEWRRETNRLDRIREACNLLDKALSK